MPTDPLQLLSSMATREVLADIVAQYQREADALVSCEAAGGVDVARRVRADERVDVVVLASNAIDSLIGEGKLLADRVDLVRSGIAVAVRAGAERPAVGTEDEVRSAVAAAASISYSTGPSGVYLEKLFARWGILDEIRARIVVPPPGVPVGSLVASGAVELGFQQLSELKGLEGIEVLGPLPSAIQSITVFSGAVAATSAAIPAARRLLQFLASPDADPIKRRHGLETVQARQVA